MVSRREGGGAGHTEKLPLTLGTVAEGVAGIGVVSDLVGTEELGIALLIYAWQGAGGAYRRTWFCRKCRSRRVWGRS